MKKYVMYLLMLVLVVMPHVLADDGQNANIDTTISTDEKAKFDSILTPVFKIYNFVKYIATVVAGIFLLYSGISYMGSGNDPRKRDQAKNIAAYVVIGLLVIWAAPMVVNLLV